ncbi:uncharacterized protein BT62DRAFT_613360 [Guyanagaster necrorhizus]|uniref:Uncharacterized protein n=1 Tax=Guyanagaster necrorhizus TaxID=856835 RepID=A0A9P7VYG7_9AGAR|nr:uncharacterized protein BT62DRAFT_613360 [Guyanagaster necrorhizus MCA 3950]KAG7449896.1 hypothetical protein BT62DRAFT_613360 [Guyanagaster necrorhizus MCA 3950]
MLLALHLHFTSIAASYFDTRSFAESRAGSRLRGMRLAFYTVFIGTATAICPGFTFGVADTKGGPPGSWRVYDDSCNPILTVFADNPCDVGVFGCSGAPITFDALHLNGLDYTCQRDNNSDTCEGFASIQVCCKGN